MVTMPQPETKSLQGDWAEWWTICWRTLEMALSSQRMFTATSWVSLQLPQFQVFIMQVRWHGSKSFTCFRTGASKASARRWSARYCSERRSLRWWVGLDADARNERVVSLYALLG